MSNEFDSIFCNGDVDTGFVFATSDEFEEAQEWLRSHGFDWSDCEYGVLDEDDYWSGDFNYFADFTDSGREKLEQLEII